MKKRVQQQALKRELSVMAKSRSQQTTAPRPDLAHHLVVYKRLCWNTATPICLHGHYSCFHYNREELSQQRL